MNSNPTEFTPEQSEARLIQLLGGPATYEEVDQIPSKGMLNYHNGFYVDCAAIFIDIRKSSDLPKKHKRPTLGKLYRAYVSECVAVLNSSPYCKQVFIQGDSVSAIFDMPTADALNRIFPLVALLNSVVDLLNLLLLRHQITPIKCGIGIDCGRALMLKAGFEGSRISDIVWMGDVVNRASHLCHGANKNGPPIRISSTVQSRINQNLISGNRLSLVDKGLLSADYYEVDLINIVLNDRVRMLGYEDGPQGLDVISAAFGFRKPPSPTLPLHDEIPFSLQVAKRSDV